MGTQNQSPADWQVEHGQIENLTNLVAGLSIAGSESLPTWGQVTQVWPSILGIGASLTFPGPLRLQRIYAANYGNTRIYLQLFDGSNFGGGLPAPGQTSISGRIYHCDPGDVIHLDRNFWDEPGSVLGNDPTAGLLFPGGLIVVPSSSRENVAYLPALSDLILEISGS